MEGFIKGRFTAIHQLQTIRHQIHQRKSIEYIKYGVIIVFTHFDIDDSCGCFMLILLKDTTTLNHYLEGKFSSQFFEAEVLTIHIL